MKRAIYMHALCMLLLGCGGNVDCPSTTINASDAGSTFAGHSLCVVESVGGFGMPCDDMTPAVAVWWWSETTAHGEETHACNAMVCPSGATCIVQSDVSGLDDGGALLMGTCR